MKTYTIRLFPNKPQVEQLNELSSLRNELWNKLIDFEQESYELNKSIRHNYDLDKEITELRKNSNLSKLNSKACQRISKEVYSSYQSFFKLIQKDKTAKSPYKIEDVNKFHTIVFNQSGWVVNSNELITINKIKLNYKSHLDLTKLDIKEIRIKFVNNKWLCDIVIQEGLIYENIITQENKILAIDLGLKRLGTGVDNKGNQIIITNKSKKISKYYLKQIAKVHSKLSNKNNGSRKYKKLKKTINKLYNKKNKQVKYTLHVQSKQLLNMNYKTIVIGDLSVKKLMNNDENKYKKISKSFAMSNLNMFIELLKQKSFKYKTDILKQNEQYTTQTNSLTGKQFKDKINLSDRTVKLSDNIEIDRDLNAAINILNKYFNNHLALMAEPLDLSNVIHNFNIMNKSLNKKPNLL
jgi:putative transposase